MLCSNMDSAPAEGEEWPRGVSNWLIGRETVEEIKWEHDLEVTKFYWGSPVVVNTEGQKRKLLACLQ